MAGVKTSGIVIKQKNLGEGDKIVTVLTNSQGVIDFVAKGARKITARKGRSVDLVNNIKFELSRSKSLPILTDVSLLNSYNTIKSDLSKLSVCYYLLEIINSVHIDTSESPKVYSALIQLLNNINNSKNVLLIVLKLKSFELYFLNIIGFGADLNNLLGKRILSYNQANILKLVSSGNFRNVDQIEYNREDVEVISNLIQSYSEQVLEKRFKKVNLTI